MKRFNHKACVKCSVFKSYCIEYQGSFVNNRAVYKLYEHSHNVHNTPYCRLIAVTGQLTLARNLMAKMLKSYRNVKTNEDTYDYLTN